MGQVKRIGRSAAVWRDLFSRQSSSGLSVAKFCRIRYPSTTEFASNPD
jgi:hypothetical protein